MNVIVIATIMPLAQYRGEVITAFETAVARVHADDTGCELYALHEAPNELVMVEKWADSDALELHSRGEAIRELNKAISGKLQRPIKVVTYSPHPAGTTSQGQL